MLVCAHTPASNKIDDNNRSLLPTFFTPKQKQTKNKNQNKQTPKQTRTKTNKR
eukprot:m.134435 g.134435  ORF g.134435 m.134435 type:complete len:53 (-) comp16915_c1_seq3:775-933(-)